MEPAKCKLLMNHFCAPAGGKIRPGLTFQLPLQNLADERGVGLAFREFHHLALEKVYRSNIASLVIGHGIRIGGNGLVAEFFNRAGVADLFKAATINLMKSASLRPDSNISNHNLLAVKQMSLFRPNADEALTSI